MSNPEIFNEYPMTGFFVAIVLSFISYQDLATALFLGFFGAIGGYSFKIVKDALTDLVKKEQDDAS